MNQPKGMAMADEPTPASEEVLAELVELLRTRGGSLTPRGLQRAIRRYRGSLVEAKGVLEQLVAEGVATRSDRGQGAGQAVCYTLQGYEPPPAPRGKQAKEARHEDPSKRSYRRTGSVLVEVDPFMVPYLYAFACRWVAVLASDRAVSGERSET